MPGVIPDVEEVRILANFVRNILALRLYSNNFTPDETMTVASFTEVTGGGYSAFNLSPGSWVLTPGAPSTAAYAQQIFAFTGATGAPGTVYGYYLVDTVTGLLIGAERFPGTVLPLNPIAGSKISVTPNVRAS